MISLAFAIILLIIGLTIILLASPTGSDHADPVQSKTSETIGSSAVVSNVCFYECSDGIVWIMKVREWPSREGLNVQTVWLWCRTGRMPVPFERTATGTILVHAPKYEGSPVSPTTGTACYARVPSADQKADLQHQADRLKAFALAMGATSPEVVMETGSGMNVRRRKLNRIFSDSSVSAIIVEHRDRLVRMNVELVESALKAQNRRLIVVDDHELDDDLVRDMTEVLTSFCARLYGRRAAPHKAAAMLKAAES